MLAEEHKTLLNSSPWASVVLDVNSPRFAVAWINPPGLQFFQANRDDLLGKSIFDLINGHFGEHSNEELAVRSVLERSLRSKSPEKAEIRYYKKSPKAENSAYPGIWNLVTYPVCDSSGAVLFLVLNPQVDASQQIKSNILESITDGFYAVDKDWTVTYWNREAERILKRPREFVIGRNLWDSFPVQAYELLYPSYQKALSDNISIELEIFYHPMNSWIEIKVFPSEEGLSIYFKDVNERKLAEEELNDAKKQYQDLFDFSPLPQWVYELETFQIKDVNQAAIQHYGYSKAEFLSMTIRDLKPPEEVEILENVVQVALNTGSFPKTSGRHVIKSGEIINVQVEGNSIMFEGKPCMLVLAVDITEITKARQDMQASEQKFKVLVQDGSDLLTILDEDGYFTYANQTTTRILEYTESDFVGKFAFDFVHEEDRAGVMEQFRTLDNEKTHNISPYRFRNVHGEYLWLETIITNMTADPAIAGVVANSRDVTSRMEIEQRMQQSIDRFNIVSRATSDAIWDYDVPTDRVIWNDVAKKLFGFKHTTYTRDWWRSHVHPDDLTTTVEAIDALVANHGSRLELEYRFQCEDGGYKHILDRSFMLYDGNGKLKRVIGSMQDMTERVRYLQRVEAQNEHLKDIAWTQSHVVRAPLARIMGIADLLSFSAAEDDPNAALIGHLASSAAELDNIIRELVKKTEDIYKG
ncbi:PAS domain S-box protein [Pedobacter sp. SAFR-022]|uniref:PAS domain-containing protein n=1 Tax=Pedobacter sp. SAFR-022 TaxID=3436861 RepID=UPI003F80363C